jgi:hypothetical protein
MTTTESAWADREAQALRALLKWAELHEMSLAVPSVPPPEQPCNVLQRPEPAGAGVRSAPPAPAPAVQEG